jgi:nitrate/nitrite-specific signal transduction histidine kinase
LFSEQVQLMMPPLEKLMAMELGEIDEAHDSADRLVAELNVLIALIIGIGILFSFVINWLIIINVIKPLRSLEEGVINFGKGDLDKRVKVFRNDEFGTLAVTFNLMAENINKTQAGLEKTVELRTTELENAKISLEKKVRERTAELEKAKSGLEKVKNDLEKIVAERTAELENRVAELKKINTLMIDRELKMIELKKQMKKIPG